MLGRGKAAIRLWISAPLFFNNGVNRINTVIPPTRKFKWGEEMSPINTIPRRRNKKWEDGGVP